MIFSSVLSVEGLSAQSGGMGSMMGGFGGSSGGFGLIGMFIGLIFWILIIVGIVLLIKWLLDQNKHGDQSSMTEGSAIEILKKRYAKGEISKEEFEQMKRDLV